MDRGIRFSKGVCEMPKVKNLKKYHEEEHCFWCGRETTSAEYVINPGGIPVMKCCCDACYDLSMDFVARDARAKPYFWGVLAVLALANLAVIGTGCTGPLGYAPLLLIAVTVFIWPSLFAHYEFYNARGLVRTRRIFRACAVVVGVLAIGAAFSVA